jgi:acyl-CoA synthetase (AMP-forming)/AMP-acid ligase II/acyl carrier protein
VVLAPATVPALGAPFTRWVRERGITLMNLPTAFWHGWVGLLDGDGPPPDGLRLVVVGGERAHPATWARWRRWTADRVRTINAYGPTETTVLATWFEEEDGAPADESREVPIGTPVAIARVYVLDPWLRPLPAGVPGELYIAGEGVSRGYHGAPGLTACRFLPDPFAAERGARMYRTGDRGRWRADGRLEITGRTDAQVKIRGFRVEPGEVETALAAHPLVAHSAVHPQRDPLGRLQLVAYVVPAPGARASADEMRAWLGERLPAYMLPAAFVELERIPLLPGGKVDHRALPAAPFHAAPAGLPSATRTQLERAVAEAWCQVLGRERVGVHENFFELGGHSLLLVQLQQELEERAGRRVPLLDLFAYPTVGELAAHLDRASAPEPAPRRSEGRRTIVRRRRPSGGVEGAGES